MYIHLFCQTEEARGLILEEHFDWVAQYLVMKRASIEPNFHTLYMNFLDQFGSVKLRKRVLKETYRNIKVYFIVSSSIFTISVSHSYR